jgi:hypothetical protein
MIKATSVPKLKDFKKVSRRERPIVFINQKYIDQEGQVLTKSVYWIIVLRRKFIPPYLDKMDEVLIVMQNPAEALLRDTSFPEGKNYYSTNYKIHDPSPNDIDENGSEVGSKVDADFGKLSWDFSVPKARQLISNIADSMTACHSTSTIYKSLITKALGSLPFRMDDYAWLANNPRTGLKPENIDLTNRSAKLLLAIYWKLADGIDLKSGQKSGLKNFNWLKTELNTMTMLEKSHVDKMTLPNLINDLIMEDTELPYYEKKHEKDENFEKDKFGAWKENLNPEWTRKFYNYLSACLDGTLLPSLTWAEFYKKIYEKSKELSIIDWNPENEEEANPNPAPVKDANVELNEMLIKLLYLGTSRNLLDYGKKIWVVVIENFNSSMEQDPTKKIYYNEHLLSILIKTNYLKGEFKENLERLVKFYDILLKNDSTSLNVKQSVLLSLIMAKEESKKGSQTNELGVQIAKDNKIILTIINN